MKKTHSCPPAQSSETKLQIMPIKDNIVYEDIDDEAVEGQRRNVVAVGRGQVKLEVEHHVASGNVQHRTWCDACMRARGIAGRREGSLVEWTRTHLLRLIKVVCLLDDAKDDDDDTRRDNRRQTAHLDCE